MDNGRRKESKDQRIKPGRRTGGSRRYDHVERLRETGDFNPALVDVGEVLQDEGRTALRVPQPAPKTR
jgi:hypothetical protein